MRDQRFDGFDIHPCCLQFDARFRFGLAAHKGFGLGEKVREQYRVMFAQGIARFHCREKIRRDHLRTLVYQLEERVLAVGANASPKNGAVA